VINSLHPASSDRDKERLALAAKSPTGNISLNEFDLHNYVETFELASLCLFWDCPLCYGNFEKFKIRLPLLLGVSLNDAEVQKAIAKRKKDYAFLKLARFSLQTIADSQELQPLSPEDFMMAVEKEKEKM
jgi:hypothetical protein